MATPTHHNARAAVATRPITDVSVIAHRPGPSPQSAQPGDVAGRRLCAGALLLAAPPATALSGVAWHTTSASDAFAAWGELLGAALAVGPTFTLVRDALEVSSLAALGVAGDVVSVWAALLLLVAGGLAAGGSRRVLAGGLGMAGAVLATITVPLRAVASLGDRPDVFADVLGVALITTGVVFLPVVAVGLAVGRGQRTSPLG